MGIIILKYFVLVFTLIYVADVVIVARDAGENIFLAMIWPLAIGASVLELLVREQRRDKVASEQKKSEQ